MYLRLWNKLSGRRKIQLSLLLLLSVMSAFAEVLSLGATIPFLAILVSPKKVLSYIDSNKILSQINILNTEHLMMSITIIFLLCIISAGFLRLFSLWAGARMAHILGSEFSSAVYTRILYQPYEMHVQWNTADLMAGINAKSNALVICINLFITMCTSIILLLTVICTLMFVDPLITMIATFGFGSVYTIVILLTRRRLVRNGQIMAHQHSSIARYLSESLGGIRDVILDGTQEVYFRKHKLADFEFRGAERSNAFLGQSPRYLVEIFGMIAIVLLAYYLAFYSNDGLGAIPMLGVFVLGAQRLLPSLQQIFGSWAGIQANKIYFYDALSFLDLPLPLPKNTSPLFEINFKKSIALVDVSYKYTPELNYVLRDINLIINKGSRVGIVGKTGGGKSTLLDIVMGLLAPTNGSLLVDDHIINDDNRRAWQDQFAHVPQNIFLSDNSIAENIALGVRFEEIDLQKVMVAAAQAQLSKTIEGWPDGYKTRVGERGIRLSGGQRQRIGLARALYRGKGVIILDEATSALDTHTESEVIKAIDMLDEKNVTIIMIAHRLTTLKSCSSIVEIEDGLIKKVGSYEDMVGKE